MARSYRNNFIIGLGGAGGLSVAAFRRATVVREVEYEAMRTSPDKRVRFEYLYIDSSVDMTDTASLWTKFGRDVALPKNDQISIASASNTFSAAKESPQITPWLGDIDKMQACAEKEKDLPGAEQMRRFGRVLFALKASAIRNQIQSKITRLHPAADENITFHIFATLGGGTGSGSLIDLITLICKQCVNTPYKIYLYLFVGGDGIPTKVNVGRFFENEFSTLRDLNALMVGKYHPHMALCVPNDGSQLDRFMEITNNPIAQVYICSDMAPVMIGKGTIKDQADFMAEACFDIIYSHFSGGANAGFKKAFSGEDILSASPAESDDGSVEGARSYRFAVLGTKRWCVPTERISEMLQLLFQSLAIGQWLNGSESRKETQMLLEDGSEERPLVFDLPQRMTSDNFNTGAKVDACLRKLIDELSGKFTQATGMKYAENTLTWLSGETRVLLKSVSGDLDDQKEFKKYEDSINSDVDEIIDAFKQVLANKRQWSANNDPWGLRDVQKCTERFAAHVGSLASTAAAATFDPEQTGNLVAREGEWAKISVITERMDKLTIRMLEAHEQECIGLLERAVNAFRQQVYSRFYERLKKELDNMVVALDKCIKSLDDAAKRLNSAYSDVRNDLMPADDAQSKDLIHSTRYDFDKDNLRNIINFLRSTAVEEYLTPMMESLELRCWEPIWKPTTTTHYHPSDPNSTNHLPKLLERLASQECAWILSREMVQTLTRRDSRYQDVYHDSLYDRLAQSWQNKSEVERRQEVVSFLSSVCTSARVSPVSPMTHAGNVAPFQALALGLPRIDNTEGELKNFIIRTAADNIAPNVDCVSNDYAPYDLESSRELRLLYCQYWMPARFLDVVSQHLHTYFQGILNNNNQAERQKLLYLTNIDDSGVEECITPKELPTLMKPSASDKAFAARFQMLEMLTITKGSPNAIAMKKADKGFFYVAKAVNTALSVPPAYEKHPMTEFSSPKPETAALVKKVLQSRIQKMDSAERAEFIAAYDKKIMEKGLELGYDHDDVEAMQKLKEYIVQQFKDITYIPDQKD